MISFPFLLARVYENGLECMIGASNDQCILLMAGWPDG